MLACAAESTEPVKMEEGSTTFAIELEGRVKRLNFREITGAYGIYEGSQPPRSTDLKIRHAFLTGAELPRAAHGPHWRGGD